MSTHPGSGLEGAPDIMLLTMAALMVAILWLAAQSQETTLPPIDLPTSEAAALGQTNATTTAITLRPGPEGLLEVFVEEELLVGGLPSLKEQLEARAVGGITLRADAGTDWSSALKVMDIASTLGLQISVAVER